MPLTWLYFLYNHDIICETIIFGLGLQVVDPVIGKESKEKTSEKKKKWFCSFEQLESLKCDCKHYEN